MTPLAVIRVTRSPSRSLPAAGEPFGTPATPILMRTGSPAAVSAVEAAACWESPMRAVFRLSTWSAV